MRRWKQEDLLLMREDFENDEQRKLRITDPDGITTVMNCEDCNAACVCDDFTCRGRVDMMSDMHLCDTHKKKFGSPEAWYESVETNSDSPFPRELGIELTNHGGEFSDDEELGESDNSEIKE